MISQNGKRILGRLAPVASAAALASLAGGLFACFHAGSIAPLTLGAAGAFVAVLPLAALLAAWLGTYFRGCGAHGVGERLRAALLGRDPDATPGPFLFLLEAAIVFAMVWQAALFSTAAFKRADLAALVVGAAAAAGFVVARLVSAALRPPLRPFARRATSGARRWLPLASNLASLVWAAGVVCAAAGTAAAVIWKDLVAADLGSLLVLAALNAFLFALCFVGLFLARPDRGKAASRAIFGLSAASGLAVILGLAGVPRGMTTFAAASGVPGVGLGLELTRKVAGPVLDRLGGKGLKVGKGSFDKPPPRFIDPSPLCRGGDCNVVLLVVDSFRADRLVAYGSRDEIMPNLDALARESVVFDNAYSPGPGTILAVPCMLAGVFDSGLKMDPGIKGPLPVSRDQRLVEEDLHDRGVVTLAALEHSYLDPLNQGWTEFSNPWSRTFYRETTAARQADVTIEMLRRYRAKPLFLYAHFNDPHHNYLMHEGFDRWGDDDAGRYASELAFTDAQLGRIFEVVRKELTERPTLLIVTGDHGESLGQHGIKYHNGGFYLELMHVPLVFSHPALKARRLAQPVSLLDLAPTFRNVFGLPPDPAQVGTSLLPDVLTGSQLKDRTIYHQALYDQGGRYYNLVGITRGAWRLFHDMRRRTYELYDVAADPREERNLADESNPRFVEMKEKLDSWLAALGLDAAFVHRPWEDAPPGARRPAR
ncbi:MAG: sulfatase [Deltaproteobacteria bacterium]|nr:sulfatase [Deltaproteobacteria bacterium]